MDAGGSIGMNPVQLNSRVELSLIMLCDQGISSLEYIILGSSEFMILL